MAPGQPAPHVNWDAVLDHPAGAAPGGRPASDSGIDLGGTPEPSASMSGISSVDWASLVEEPAPRTGDAQAAVDSPSDADLLREQGGADPITLPPTRRPAVVQPEPPPAAPITPPHSGLASEQEMARDLFPEEEPAVDLGATPPAGSGISSVKIAQPGKEEEVVDLGVPLAGADSSGISLQHLGRHLSETPSGILRAEEEVLAGLADDFSHPDSDSGPPSGSSVDLGQRGSHPSSGPSSPESGVDLVNLPPSSTRLRAPEDIVDIVEVPLESTAAPLSGPLAAAAPDSGIELDDALDLESPLAPPEGESPSGRDLIAEAVESGVDLEMAPVEPEEARPTDRLPEKHEPVHPVLGQVVDSGPASSSVDLSSGDIDLPPKEFRAELEQQGGRTHKPRTAEAIDLEGLPPMGSGDSGMNIQEASPSAVDLGSRPVMPVEEPAVPADSNIEVEEAEVVDLETHGAPVEQSSSGSSIFSETLAYEASPGEGAPPGEEEMVDEEPSVVEEPIAEQPFAEQLIADQPVADEPVTEEPVAEEPVAAEPSVVEETMALGEEGVVIEEPEAVGEEPSVEEEAPAGEEAGEEEGGEVSTLAEEGELVGAGVGGEEEPAAAVGAAPPPRSRAPAWFGGTLLGLILGAGGAVGLSVAGIEPWRTASGPPTTKGTTGGPQQKSETQLAAERRDHISRGDYDRALGAGIEQAKEDDKEQLAARGEYRWFYYLQKNGPAKVDPKAKEVQAAIADLTKAETPAALLLLGQIYEVTDPTNPAKAEEAYDSAAKKTQDPVWKKRFERLKAAVKARLQPADEDKEARLPVGENDLGALAVRLLILLQDPPKTDKKPDPKGADADEAGFEFWDAVKLARAQDYKGALEALDKARELHKQRRLQNLRKAQNPLSDPTEEIFLRTCDEIKTYWNMQAKLKEAGYLEAKKSPAKALDAVIAKATDGGEAGKLIKDLGDKLVKEEIIKKPEDLEKGITQLLADKKEAETKLADAEKMIKTLKTASADLSDKLKKSSDDLKERDDQLKKEKENLRVAKAALEADQATLEKVIDDLADAKYLDKKAGKAGIQKGLQAALRMAAVVDPKGLVRSLEERVDRDEAALRERWKPEEMLSFWLPLLDSNRDRDDLAKGALADARRVQADEAATPADRARAEIIRGLALRNEEQFAEAKVALEKGLGGLGGDRNPFIGQAEAALKMVENPGAWYAAQARILQGQGKSDEALEFLGKALKNLPAKEQAALLAQRSLLELDAARSLARERPIPLDDANLVAARKDASAAAKAGLAEGFYAAGRVAEELGRWDDAAANYRKAMAAHPDLDAAGARYRVSLARVLVQPRDLTPAFVPPAPKPADEEKGKKAAAAPALLQRLDAQRLLAVILSVALQGALDGPNPAQDEAEKLADEVLKGGDAVPFDVRAQALAVKGRWTAALNTFAEGLQGHLPAMYAQELLSIVRNHPRLKPPEGLAAPNPLDAEKHYSAGVNFYFARDYQSAEKEFQEAVDSDSQDARYFYFLALSRLMQGKRGDAAEDLDRGALLERAGRPAPSAVSEALERVQGEVRRIVNEARSRPR
jgi:hypothetical protein